MFAPALNDTFRIPSAYITPWSREGALFNEPIKLVPASATYPAVNRAYYHRITVPSPITIYKLFWLNGATASTNNFQVGLYADDGTSKPGAAVLRGTSTLASGANVCQYDNVTDTTIGAGVYWMAIWGSGTTATLFGASLVVTTPAYVYLESSLAAGLPTTATPASANAGRLHVFGLVTRSTP